MKVGIEVKDRAEAEAIKVGLSDPVTRAIVVTMGMMLQLPDDRARRRVLDYVADRLDVELVASSKP